MKKYLLFDFDGVVADTFLPSYESYCEIYDNPVTLDVYRTFFNGNIFDSDEVKKQNLDTYEDLAETPYYRAFLPRLQKAQPFHDVLEALHRLHKDHTLVVISSSITMQIKDFLVKHGAHTVFDRVYGSDLHKSKVVKIEQFLSEYATEPEECVFITDTIGDMREAYKKNIDSIGVTWGFQTVDLLKQGNPIALVDSAEELESTIRAL